MQVVVPKVKAPEAKDEIVEVEIRWKSGRREVFPFDYEAKNAPSAKLFGVYIWGADGDQDISVLRGRFDAAYYAFILADLKVYVVEKEKTQ